MPPSETPARGEEAQASAWLRCNISHPRVDPDGYSSRGSLVPNTRGGRDALQDRTVLPFLARLLKSACHQWPGAHC